MSIEEAIESLNSPEQLATTQFYNIKNNCASVLNATIDAIQTSLVLVAGGGAIFPTAPFYLSCEFEVMKCTGKSTDTLTITRGFDGTTAAAHTAGAIVEQRNNAALWTDLQSAVNNIESGTTPIPLNVPDGSITNIKLASDVFRPSLLQNGAFDQWHRGPGPFAVSQIFNADQWLTVIDAADTLSISRDSVNQDSGQYCAACTFTKVSGIFTGLQQALYGNPAWPNQNNLHVAGKTVTASVRVKTAVANAVRVGVYNGTAWVYGSYHTGNGQYQTLTSTAAIAANAVASYALINFSASCTAYVDNIACVIGAAQADYFPAQIPDVIPNERLASDVDRRNLLLNGDFNIWQRGAGPFAGATSSRVFGPDRWQWIQASGTTSMARDSANTDGSSSIYTVAITTSASGSGDLRQDVAGSSGAENVTYNIRGKTVAVSARVKCTVANAIRFTVNDGVAAVSSQFHTGSGAYETLTAVIDCSPGAAAFMISFGIAASASTFYIAKVMMVYGSVPTIFYGQHPADDLARCLRYYEKIPSDEAGGALSILGIATAAIQPAECTVWLKARKAVAPTYTKVGTWGVSNCVQPYLITNPGIDGCVMETTSLAAGTFFSRANAGAYLTVEANP